MLSDEYGEFVHVWDSEHLGHKVVAEVARSHLHHLPCFPQLINRLQHNKKGMKDSKQFLSPDIYLSQRN